MSISVRERKKNRDRKITKGETKKIKTKNEKRGRKERQERREGAKDGGEDREREVSTSSPGMP